jgi:hypothetical protein
MLYEDEFITLISCLTDVLLLNNLIKNYRGVPI